MSANHLEVAPVLSTPDVRMFDSAVTRQHVSSVSYVSEEQLLVQYEIERTVRDIRHGQWKRIALQFPDPMLVDAPRVFQALSRGLESVRKTVVRQTQTGVQGQLKGVVSIDELAHDLDRASFADRRGDEIEKLFILADTSYGACCIDEVAAEHANADVVVHYGRSCLSPTARLPVIYVFTQPPLDIEALILVFKETYRDTEEKVLLMADIPYQEYLLPITERLNEENYKHVFTTGVIHDIASPLPNRTIPPEVKTDPSPLATYSLFHVADPPPSLLLTVSSRVKSIQIYSTASAEPLSGPLRSTATTAQLRRRYALLTRLSTAPVIGILINTLSVRSYMVVLSHLKSIISAAGKKFYTFVVGKVNAAKVANFAEVGGWVVVGCWESSLFDSSEFWKPVVTPWELEMALKQDEDRVWTGEWRGDFEAVLETQASDVGTGKGQVSIARQMEERKEDEEDQEKVLYTINGETHAGGNISDDESAPPEFDLRTGQYVSHSRPMGQVQGSHAKRGKPSVAQRSLMKRANGDLATIGGEVSPAAEFFKSNRTWQGLGSDYVVEYDGEGAMKQQEAAKVEVGRSGIARGYVVGDNGQKR